MAWSLLARAAEGARAGTAPGAAATLWALASDPPAELLERLTRADRHTLERFAGWITGERRAAARLGPAELIERGVRYSGYDLHVLSLPWPERRLANVHKLARLARRFEAAEAGDLRAFLDHASGQREPLESSEPVAPVAELEPDAVRLMSIHAAKGLEFPVVCLADLGRAVGPRLPSLLLDGARVGLRLATLDGSEPVATLDYEELAEERRAAEAEEEDRILYVAMTRAQERLLLSGTADLERWPSPGRASPPIDWLAPGLLADLPALLADQQAQGCEDAQPARLDEVPVRAPGVCQVPLRGQAEVRVRCLINAPATLGEALREECLADPAPGPPRGAAPVPDGRPAPPPARGAAPAPPRASGAHEHDSARAPRLPGQDPADALSYTTLSELERCGYRHYLERVLGIPPSSGRAHPSATSFPGRRLGGRERGVLVHRLLERRDPEAPAVSRQEVERAARGLGITLGAPEPAEVAGLLQGIAGTSLAGRLEGAAEVHVEYPFTFLLGRQGRLLTGILDVLAIERGGSWLIVDYKTDRLGAVEDLEQLAEGAYGLQRELYALAGLRAGAQAVEVAHWFLERPGAWVIGRWRAAARSDLEARLEERVARILERGFAVSRRPHRRLCRDCPGLRGLCSWSPAETSREDPCEAPSTDGARIAAGPLMED